jgi:putative MATE family efflux protein
MNEAFVSMNPQRKENDVDKTSQLGEKNIVSLMAQFSLPSIVAMMVGATYNVINMSFIGRSSGSLGIAAIAISMPVTMISAAINQLIGNGCAACVSIKLGQGEKDKAQEILGNSVFFSLIVATVITVIANIFLDPILVAFGASDAILPYARQYMRIMLLAMIFGSFATMNSIMRIEGYPIRAMISMLLGTAVNLLFSPLLIFVFHMGIRGAAIGTLCAQFATSIWIFTFLVSKKRVVRLRWKYSKLKLENLTEVARLGLPNFLMQFAQSMLSAVMNTSLGMYGGDIAISSWGIITSIMNLISQPIFGLNQGAQPIIGYNIGAGNYKRVRQSMACVLTGAMFFSFLGWGLTRLFPAQLFAFFNKDPELIAMGTHMISVFMSFLFIVGFQQAGASYFQNAGNPRISVLLTLSRQALILAPCVLILSHFYKLDGILISGPIADVSSAMLTGIFIMLEVKKLRNLEQKTPLL